MADSKISQLPAAGALGGTELVPGVQNGGNVAMTVAQLRAGLATSAQGAKADAALPNVPASVRAAIQATAEDPAQAPLMGAALDAARMAQTKDAMLTAWNAELAKQDLIALVVPEGTTMTAGALLTISTALSGQSNIYQLAVAPVTGTDQLPLSFYVTDADGLAYEATFANGEAYDLMMSGAPYQPTVKTLASNVLTFDARGTGDGRNIHVTTPLAANMTIAASCWDYILDTDPAPVRLHVAIGGTTRTITAASGPDGLRAGANPVFGTNTTQVFELYRVNGVPAMHWVAELVATASVPTYVGVAKANTLASTSAWTLDFATGTKAGDTVVVWQTVDNTSVLPPIATVNGTNLTDSGLGGDANAPGVRLCWKENLTAAEVAAGLAGAAGSKQVYALTFRKAGGVATIATGLATYNKTAAGTTATVTWPAITIAQDCLLAGLVQLLGSAPPDDAPLRGNLTEVASRTVSSISRVGVSGLLDHPSDTIGATTTAKTGVAGRAVTSQVVIY